MITYERRNAKIVNWASKLNLYFLFSMNGYRAPVTLVTYAVLTMIYCVWMIVKHFSQMHSMMRCSAV